MNIAPHYSVQLPLGFTDQISDCIMYYYKLDEYPAEKESVIEHELNHLQHGKWNFIYHLWLDYKDTPRLLNSPNIRKIVTEKEKAITRNFFYNLAGNLLYVLPLFPLQIYTAVRLLVKR